MLPHRLTSFEIQRHYSNETKFNSVYSRNNSSKINLSQLIYILIALELNILQEEEVKKLIDNKNIITNIYRIQACNSIMREYFCIRFINFMLKGKNVLDYNNLFSLN